MVDCYQLSSKNPFISERRRPFLLVFLRSGLPPTAPNAPYRSASAGTRRASHCVSGSGRPKR